MSIRKLPILPSVDARGVHFDPPQSALNQWDAALRAQDGASSIEIYEPIGPDDYGGASAKRIAAHLRALGAHDVVVNINSPGGDFFEGIAIYNLLRAHPHNVTVRVIGLAASAASLVAMAGDVIQVAKAGSLMIHNTMVLAIGNRNDLREAADVLERFDGVLADLYAQRTGNEISVVAKMLDAETWFSGPEAVDAGFADALLPADQLAKADIDDQDQTRNALRRLNLALARSGIPRSERRALLNQVRVKDADEALDRRVLIYAQEIESINNNLKEILK